MIGELTPGLRLVFSSRQAVDLLAKSGFQIAVKSHFLVVIGGMLALELPAEIIQNQPTKGDPTQKYQYRMDDRPATEPTSGHGAPWHDSRATHTLSLSLYRWPVRREAQGTWRNSILNGSGRDCISMSQDREA